jgi:hypothetical protein
MAIYDYLGAFRRGQLAARERHEAKRAKVAAMFDEFRQAALQEGRSVSPQEFHSFIDQITGGEQYLRRYLPTDQIIAGMSRATQERARQLREERAFTAFQRKQTIQQTFQNAVDSMLLSEPDDRKIIQRLREQYDDPALRETLGEYIAGLGPDGLKQRRARLAHDRAAEWMNKLPQELTADQVEVFMVGEHPTVVQATKALAAARDRERYEAKRREALMAVVNQLQDPFVIKAYGDGNLAKVKSALNVYTAPFGVQVDDALLGQIKPMLDMKLAQIREDERIAGVNAFMADVQNDPVLLSVISKAGVTSEEAQRGMQFYANKHNIALTDDIYRQVIERAEQFENAAEQQRVIELRNLALKTATEQVDALLTQNTNSLAAIASQYDKNSPEYAALNLLSQSHYVTNLAPIPAILDQTGSSDPVAIMNEIVAALGDAAIPKAEFRQAAINQRASAMAGPPMEPFRNFQARQTAVLENAVNNWQRVAAQATTQEEFYAIIQIYLDQIDAALLAAQEAALYESRYMGYDHAANQRTANALKELRDALEAAQPPADLPTAEELAKQQAAARNAAAAAAAAAQVPDVTRERMQAVMPPVPGLVSP